MADKIHKEDWVNTVMNSTQNIMRATPSPALSAKVLSGLNGPLKARMPAIPLKQWAAAAIVLLALNIGSVVYFTSQETKREQGNANTGMPAGMILESTYNY